VHYCGKLGGLCKSFGGGEVCQAGVVKCTDNAGCSGVGSGVAGDPYKLFCTGNVATPGDCRVCNAGDCAACDTNTGVCQNCSPSQCVNGPNCDNIGSGYGAECGTTGGGCTTCTGSKPICTSQRCTACLADGDCPGTRCLGAQVGIDGQGSCVSLDDNTICKSGATWVSMAGHCHNSGACTAPCGSTTPICTATGCRACVNHTECGGGSNKCQADGSCATFCGGCDDSNVCQAGTSTGQCGGSGNSCMDCSAGGNVCVSGGCVQCGHDYDCPGDLATCRTGVCNGSNTCGLALITCPPGQKLCQDSCTCIDNSQPDCVSQ
jgi:hypothetical protein